MSVPKPTGPVPKPSDKRRRANKPNSYGLAEPIKAGAAAPQPELNIVNAHELVVSMWAALSESVESRFFSHADWQRARMELFYANKVIRGRGRPSGQAWAVLQAGLSDLLISPADKRRIGIELQQATADEDEVAAVVQMATYQEKLAQA